ncbi:MAG: head GIN domain-containing protein [Bacteroidota bacterium]
MKTLKTLLVAAALVVTTGLAKADTQDRHLTGFTSVAVAGSYDVFITQGSSESVKVDAPSNIIDKIITEVQGGVLKIYTKEGTSWNWNTGNKKMIVYVSIKDVNAVSLAGSGDVVFKDGLRATSLKIKLTGSGDISGKVDVKNLESSIGGSGDITLSGRADNSVVSVVGSGDFTGQNLVTTNTQVKVAGSGDARVNANDKIDASLVGSGDVHYTGSAKNISSSKAGSGSVSRM